MKIVAEFGITDMDTTPAADREKVTTLVTAELNKMLESPNTIHGSWRFTIVDNGEDFVVVGDHG